MKKMMKSLSGLLGGGGVAIAILLIGSVVLFNACKNGSTDNNKSGADYAITEVTVSPKTPNVAKGGSQDFQVTVKGEYPDGSAVPEDKLDKSVQWLILETTKHAQTTISDTGRLSVSADESLTQLTVHVRSRKDYDKGDNAAVTVFNEADMPTVTGVTVSPASPALAAGATQAFSATVNGTNSPGQGVTWSVEGTSGTKHAETAIDAEGLLTVAGEETLTSLTVTATSTVDNTKSGTATVTVTPYVPAAVNSVTVSPASVMKGSEVQLNADVDVTGAASTAVTWEIETAGKHANTTISGAGLLTVSRSETQAALTVKATSVFDGTKSGTATVTLNSKPNLVIGPQWQSDTPAVAQDNEFVGGVVGHGRFRNENAFVLKSGEYELEMQYKGVLGGFNNVAEVKLIPFGSEGNAGDDLIDFNGTTTMIQSSGVFTMPNPWGNAWKLPNLGTNPEADDPNAPNVVVLRMFDHFGPTSTFVFGVFNQYTTATIRFKVITNGDNEQASQIMICMPYTNGRINYVCLRPVQSGAPVGNNLIADGDFYAQSAVQEDSGIEPNSMAPGGFWNTSDYMNGHNGGVRFEVDASAPAVPEYVMQ